MNRLLPLLVGLGLFLLCGCAGVSDAVSDGTLFAVVVDQAGREVALQEAPERIVSLSPANTEIAFALGLADRVAGVTEFCNYPAGVETKTRVGDFANPNLELILELQADLVLVDSLHGELVPHLEDTGVAVLVLAPETLEEVCDSLLLVGEATGRRDRGELLVEEMKERVARVRAILAYLEEEEKVRVYYEVFSDPLMSVGAGAVINEIIVLAGGINIFADVAEQYPPVSVETVLERKPQVVLFPDYRGDAGSILAEMKKRPGWANIPALQENRAYAVDDDIFSRPGPRVVEAIEQAAKLFYPELFD